MDLNGGAKSTNYLTNLLNKIRSYSPNNPNASKYDIAGHSSDWGRGSIERCVFNSEREWFMKVKYKEGDIFVIPMSNGKYALCQVVFAPKQKFKQVLGFCILTIQDTEEFKVNSSLTPLSLEKFGKEMKVLFIGNQNISKGIWKIIGYADLTEEKKQLKIFNYAGGLYDGEEEIRRLSVAEYPNYTTMGVSGFELVDNVLINI
ncbi:immunity 26/phosphotriesterase HocA family protein [Enterobacter bugandensis]|uniref:immunity 26/phosphotriesterase HocA family protein n=1 Tax=Enterobacter bugandensis TaxID=881260 RepID=UPI002893040E|nr:immunity 26/phosphotriesterase HocA family protein [Enterobacter bugandensis]